MIRQLRLALLGSLIAGPVLAGGPPPDYEAVRAGFASSEAWLLDRRGEPLSSVRLDPGVRRLDWVRLEELSPRLKEALVASEDRRFFEHGGVDWQAFVAALWDNLQRGLDGRRPRGGSTLSMQLAAMLDESLRARGAPRSLEQKWDQAMAARELERRWTKAQILEAYLNLAAFRGELQGVAAAARGLFGKAPSGLDEAESVILAALLRAPNAAPALVGRRACTVAAQAGFAGDCERIESLAVAALSGRYRIDPEVDLAPHLARRLLAEPGSRVTSTLDARLQRFAVDALTRHLGELSGRNVEDGAVLVLDNASGEVLAYVGSSGDLSRAAQVDGVAALRQAGSTLKPFLYGLALERRMLTAASVLDDSPLSLATPVGLYVPQNYERHYLGKVSLRTALGASLNVPAVRTAELVGIDAFHGRLLAFGLSSLTRPADYYGPALALGSADVSLLALTNAYRALANGGELRPVSFKPADGAAPGRRAMSAAAAFIVADILADRAARAPVFGLENPLATRVWSAVKTGTSKDMRDNWCVGFTDRYTVGVWVGNFGGSPMRDVSGVSGAAPVWREIVHFLHAAQPSVAPKPPAGVVAKAVSYVPQIEAARREWFLAGTETGRIEVLPEDRGPVPRIAYPPEGTILALDPDIPADRQRVVLQARPRAAGLVWLDAGRVIDTDGGRAAWTPRPGRHRLVLTDADGRELDAVSVEVRGAAGLEEAQQQGGEQR
ncbi:MAG TPA: penicillin-binding protein 1C [Rhodocyclaceae bacterium]|nr:penicillin-binding protein 1C [Rhodocyclaceae bacterium]